MRAGTETALVPHNILPPGTMLADRYQIDEVIGIGGMGAVYRARDRRFRAIRRSCAVKEMFDQLRDATAREQARLGFEREANILASLNHPAIPKVFDFFTDGARHYLVMEYIEGKDLGQTLRERDRPLEPETVLDWALQIAEVLEYLHDQQPPVIFRDMKPSNVMRRGDGRLVLVDFGIAKHFKMHARGTMIGTEGYAPPEQYEGISDPRVDVYALGASLHHLLTNTNPQDYRPFSFEMRPIRRYNPSIPADFEAVITRALAYDPRARWSSIQELRAALRRLSAGATKPADTSDREIAAGAKHRAPPTSAILLSRLAPQPVLEPPPGPKPAPRVAKRDQPVQPVWRFECREEVRSTPTTVNNRLFVGSYDHFIYSLDKATGALDWKFGTGGGIPGTPALYERFVIVGSEDHSIYALNLHTGQPEWRFQTQGRVRSSPRVLHNRIVIGSDDGHVYALNAAGGSQLWKARVGAPVRSSATFSEKHAIIGGEDGVLYALDLSTGEITWRVHTNGAIVSSPLFAGERVVVGSLDWTVYGIDPASGFIIWRFRTSDMVISSPALADGRVYIGSVDGTMACLDAEWGKVLWRQQLGGQVTSSPAVADGFVYVGCTDGALYCLKERDGQIAWKFETGGPVPGSPAVSQKLVYIGSTDHNVYALPASGR